MLFKVISSESEPVGKCPRRATSATGANLTKIFCDNVTWELPVDPVVGKACGHLFDRSTVQKIGAYCPCCRAPQEWVKAPLAVRQAIDELRIVGDAEFKIAPRYTVTESEILGIQDSIKAVASMSASAERLAIDLVVYLGHCDRISSQLPDVPIYLMKAFNAVTFQRRPVLILMYANRLFQFDLEQKLVDKIMVNKRLAERALGLVRST